MPSLFPPQPSRRRRARGQLSAGIGRWSSIALGVGVLVAFNFALPSLSGQVMDLEELGLFGSQYQKAPSGTETAGVDVFNTAGYVGGFNLRFGASGVALGRDAWLTDTATRLSLQVGLTAANGAEFENALAVATYAAGYRSSTVEYLSANGFAAGSSQTYAHFIPGANTPGSAVWVANKATGQTIRVGLTGSGFAKSTGFVMSLLGGITLQGETWGSSSIYGAGDADLGSAAWVADSSGTTQRVGFWTGGYVRSDGLQNSTVSRILANGYAAGISSRFAGGQPAGQQAWVQNARQANSTAVAVGLGVAAADNTEFVRVDGYRDHGISFVSDGIYVGGYSARYVTNTFTQNGQGAWVYNTSNASILRVGFTGADYTSTTNIQRSDVLKISDNGLAVGTSQRYPVSASNAFRGSTTFVTNLNVGSYVEAGLTSGVFTSSTGYRVSTPVAVTSSGWVFGTASRYKPADTSIASNGSGTWVASASTGSTFQIGLTAANGAEFAGTSGFESSLFSTKTKPTESGYAAGLSRRYVGGSLSGNAAWIARASDHSTTRLGLYTGVYVSSLGFQNSEVEFLTESGYAAGYSERYLPSDTDTATGGAASWIYNIGTTTFTPITLSIRVTDGYSNTRILAFYETGLALGTYELFNPTTGALLGDRAFAWTPTAGVYDLGNSLGATLGIEGWSSLQSARYADIYGRIVGLGTRISGPGDSVYLLSVIPEPGTTALAALGLLLGACSRHRRRAA